MYLKLIRPKPVELAVYVVSFKEEITFYTIQFINCCIYGE